MRLTNFIHRHFTLIAAALCAVAVLAVSPAHAAQVDGTGLVELAREFFVSAATVVAAAIVGFLALSAKKWFGVELDAKHREALHDAIQRGMGRAIDLAANAAKDKATFEVDNKLTADVANYVTKHTPDALKHFDLTPDRLTDLITANFGALAIASEAVTVDGSEA